VRPDDNVRDLRMEIREAQPGDLDAWVALRRALWPEDPSESLVAEAKRVLASPDEVCFLLLHPSLGAVGFIEAALHPGADAPYAHVEGWYVAPEHRRQGQGENSWIASSSGACIARFGF